MIVPFTKSHGARNDFLLTWRGELPPDSDRVAIAVAICDRHSGIGADGWMILDQSPDADAAIALYNSDGSASEISGNGTRCAAAALIESGHVNTTEVRISTGAGIKYLKMLDRSGRSFQFEMNMGSVSATPERLHFRLSLKDGPVDAAILDVGNPQCAVFSEDFDFDWRNVGAEIERHSQFPNRTNVSFVRVLDRHTIEVRFFERGAGETMSSGTGSTGAAAAAVLRGECSPPVRVVTPAGALDLRWQNDDIYLTGPAEIIAKGAFIYE
jgi:diaminopimelate epimerase